MNPVIFYVDDQEPNLIVFKKACPKDWDVHTYDNPLSAVRDLHSKRPWVILSDQKMPVMKGFEFLEICKEIIPTAVRIIVTGHNDEGLMISSLRKAQITDLIKKPWDESELLTRIIAGISHYKSQEEANRLQLELKVHQKEIKDANSHMAQLIQELTLSKTREETVRRELERWVPPFIVKSIETGAALDSIKRDIAGIAFDIKGSRSIISKVFNGKPIRNHVIQVFTESVLRSGGVRESISGDSSYGHFGLLTDHQQPADAALSAALDFKAAVHSISQLSSNPLNIGIALHFATESPVHIHTTHFQTESGISAQKSFDTSSYDTDLLHRIEKVVHVLPGTSIVMTKQFLSRLGVQPLRLFDLGMVHVEGVADQVHLSVVPSEEATQQELESLKAHLSQARKAA